MKYRIMIAACCALILCALSGCQLARENAGSNKYEDRLIGVFITMEHLDLFDFEGYLNDNFGALNGGEITMDGKTQKYEGRLYATKTTSTEVNKETGQTFTTEKYVFEGAEGMAYFAPTVRAADEAESYITTVSDEAFSDVKIALNQSDDESSTALEATIYAAQSNKEHIYYFNPVYQDADGRVYTVTGSGFAVSTEAYSEGEVFSQTFDAKTTITENGKAVADSISIKISINVKLAPEKIVILQMNAKNELISSTDFGTEAMPGDLALEAGAAYFIVETYSRDETGSPKVSREIYGREAESFSTFHARPDGICVKSDTQIL